MTQLRPRDISLNGNLSIGGNLSVSQFSSNKTITTTNYQLVVAEDLSLNGRVIGSSDASFGGNVWVGGTNGITVTGGSLSVQTGGQNVMGLYYNDSTNAGNVLRLVGNTSAGGYNNLSQNSDIGLIYGKVVTTCGLVIAPQNGAGGVRMSSSGNVGIGVSNPQYVLDVSSVSTQPFRVGVGATNALVVNTVGNVGIGTTNPQTALDVSGAIRVSGGITTTYSTLPTFTSGQVGYVDTTTTLSATSIGSGGAIVIASANAYPPGVYMIVFALAKDGTGGGGSGNAQIFVGPSRTTTTGAWNINGLQFLYYPGSNYIAQTYTVLWSNTGTNYVLGWLQPPNTTWNIYSSTYLQVARIA